MQNRSMRPGRCTALRRGPRPRSASTASKPAAAARRIAPGEIQGRLQQGDGGEGALGGREPLQQGAGLVQPALQDQVLQHRAPGGSAGCGCGPPARRGKPRRAGRAPPGRGAGPRPRGSAAAGGRASNQAGSKGWPQMTARGSRWRRAAPVDVAQAFLGGQPVFGAALQEGQAEGRQVPAQAVQQQLAGVVAGLAGRGQGLELALALGPPADRLEGRRGQGPESVVHLPGHAGIAQQVQHRRHAGRVGDPGLGLGRHPGAHQGVGQVAAGRRLADGAHGQEQRLGQGAQLVEIMIGHPKNRHPIRLSAPGGFGIGECAGTIPVPARSCRWSFACI